MRNFEMKTHFDFKCNKHADTKVGMFNNIVHYEKNLISSAVFKNNKVFCAYVSAFNQLLMQQFQHKNEVLAYIYQIE